MTFVFDDTTGGSAKRLFSDVVTNKTEQKQEIEFDEDLILYKVQVYDSDMGQTYERYIVAIDFEDAQNIAKAYFETGCDSITGVWEVDIVISRYYD